MFFIVLAEALGMPVPAAMALVAGGAAAAAGVLSVYRLLLLAVLAMLLGDVLLFVAGRYMGWGLLGFLCKLSVNPETCILRSAESFYKRGKATLLFAKFIPGINTMAPPLAGSMRMPLDTFLRLDLAGGSALRQCLYCGRLLVPRFSGFLDTRLSNRGSRGRSCDRSRAHRLRALPGLAVSQACRLSGCAADTSGRSDAPAGSEDKDKVLLMDVRSHGYYDAGTARIKGSIRLEPNNLKEELKNIPKDKDIYVYCT